MGVHFCSTTNSTHFTDCCGVAINDNESKCPRCGEEVPGDGRERHNQAMERWYGREKVMDENLSREELLDTFQSKAGCMHSQHKANSAWRLLRSYLTEKQLGELITAWGHHRDVGLGRAELDEACDEVRKEWRS